MQMVMENRTGEFSSHDDELIDFFGHGCVCVRVCVLCGGGCVCVCMFVFGGGGDDDDDVCVCVCVCACVCVCVIKWFCGWITYQLVGGWFGSTSTLVSQLAP